MRERDPRHQLYITAALTLSHLQSRRPVNRVHQLHIPKTLFAIRLGLLVVENAVGEMIGLADELRGIAIGVGLVDRRLALDLRLQVLALITESGFDMQPSLRSMHTIKSGHVRAVRRVAARHDAGGEV